MKVWQAQCVCPNGHVLTKSTNETRDDESPKFILVHLKNAMDHAMANGQCDPWCNMCRAPATEWEYRTIELPYVSLHQAHPHLEDDDEIVAGERELYYKFMFPSTERH